MTKFRQLNLVNSKMKIFQEVGNTIVETFNEISVHGFVFLVKRGTSLVERLIWLICICFGIFGIVKLGGDTWNRYQTNPTVISMDRNKFSWNTSFPSCKTTEFGLKRF